MNAGSRIIELHFLSQLTDHVNGFQDRLEEMNMHTLLSGCSLLEKKCISRLQIPAPVPLVSYSSQ